VLFFDPTVTRPLCVLFHLRDISCGTERLNFRKKTWDHIILLLHTKRLGLLRNDQIIDSILKFIHKSFRTYSCVVVFFHSLGSSACTCCPKFKTCVRNITMFACTCFHCSFWVQTCFFPIFYSTHTSYNVKQHSSMPLLSYSYPTDIVLHPHVLLPVIVVGF